MPSTSSGLTSLAAPPATSGMHEVLEVSTGVPLAMAFSSFMWAYLLAVVFGFAFALYPAWKASKLSPMEALRYE